MNDYMVWKDGHVSSSIIVKAPSAEAAAKQWATEMTMRATDKLCVHTVGSATTEVFSFNISPDGEVNVVKVKP